MEPSSTSSIWDALNWVDLCLLVGLGGSALVGLGVGLYRLLALAAALAVGLVAAGKLAAPIARSEALASLRADLGEPGVQALAYGGVLLVSFLLGLALLFIFRRYFGRSLRLVDAVLGATAGAAVGAFVFGLFTLGLFHLEETRLHEPIRQSVVGSRIARGARVASRLFPEQLRARIEEGFERHLPAVLEGEVEIRPAVHREQTDDGSAPPGRPGH